MCISRLYRDGFSGGTEVAVLLPLTPMLLLPQSVLPLLQEKKFSSYSMLSVPREPLHWSVRCSRSWLTW